jgi:hypothetical protein
MRYATGLIFCLCLWSHADQAEARSMKSWLADVSAIAAEVELGSPAPAPAPAKVKRSQCTYCKGTGRVRTGDGISWTECDRCIPDSQPARRPAKRVERRSTGRCGCGADCACTSNENCGCLDAREAAPAVDPAIPAASAIGEILDQLTAAERTAALAECDTCDRDALAMASATASKRKDCGDCGDSCDRSDKSCGSRGAGNCGSCGSGRFSGGRFGDGSLADRRPVLAAAGRVLVAPLKAARLVNQNRPKLLRRAFARVVFGRR